MCWKDDLAVKAYPAIRFMMSHLTFVEERSSVFSDWLARAEPNLPKRFLA